MCRCRFGGCLQRVRHHLRGLIVSCQQVDGRRGYLARQRRVLRQEVHLQNAQQHHDRSNERVKKKLDRSVQTILAAPDSDQEIHRHERYFEEQVKQKQVHRSKHTDHRRLQSSNST